MKKQLNVEVEAGLIDQLRRLARARERYLAQEVRLALKEHVHRGLNERSGTDGNPRREEEQKG